MSGFVHIKRSSETLSSGYFWFLAAFQASKLLTAHFVVLSVFAGVTPLDRAATCLSVTNAAKWVELELPAAVPEVWLVLRLHTVVVGGSVVGGSVVGRSVVGRSVVGGSVVGGSAVGGLVVGVSVLGRSVLGGLVVGGSVVGGSAVGRSVVVVGRLVVGGSVVGRSVVDVAVVGVAVVTLESAPRQPVHSYRPRQVLENGHAISLSP